MQILHDYTSEHKAQLQRGEKVIQKLDMILAGLLDAELSEVWRGIALRLAEGYCGGKS